MKPILYFLLSCIVAISFICSPGVLQAQNIKAGDTVYFRMYQAEERRYFKSPIYVIATVRAVIGSSAILDTEMYLYKCRTGDSHYKMGTKLVIAKPFGVGHLYTTWKASQNKGYRWSAKALKPYNESTEKSITKGRIENNRQGCMVLTD